MYVLFLSSYLNFLRCIIWELQVVIFHITNHFDGNFSTACEWSFEVLFVILKMLRYLEFAFKRVDLNGVIESQKKTFTYYIKFLKIL